MEVDYRPQRCLRLNSPHIVGYMSVDLLRQYHNDLSQLKYLTSIPKKRLRYNLNHNIDKAVKRTTDNNDEKISLLLKFLLQQKDCFQFLKNPDTITFITYRRTLISVMISTYSHEPVSIVASLYNKCIYLCSIEKMQEAQKRNNDNAKFCAWGYKFEQYMLSEMPNLHPDIEKPVIENEEFSLYYSTQLGKHRLFYAAQIDGMLATNGTVTPPPKTNDLDSILTYLRNNQYAELKTNREIYSHRQEQNFKRYKMLRCWCQCYLAGLKGLLVGYRNDYGLIQRVQWFDTDNIVRYCQDEWEPQATLDYLNYFLTYVENCFESLKASCGDGATEEPLTLKFDIDRDKKITVHKDLYKEHVILPDWYVNNIQSQC